MAYSRKRLAVLGIAWVFLALLIGIPLDMDADAQNTNCDFEPCKFPAESNVGGIVLGTSSLSGDDLTAWDGLSNADLPPNRDNIVGTGGEEVIGLGLNDVDADNFFLYKSFKFDSDGDGTNDANTYVWAGAETGSLSGTGTCGTGSGDPSDGRSDCDLFVETGEVSFGQIDAVGEVCILLCTSFDITASEYWVIDPQDDTECGIFDAVLGGNMCLELIVDGSFAGDTADVSVDAEDVLIRGHSISAVEDDSGIDKELDLQDVYIEMRWRKGGDRAQDLGFGDPINDPDVTRSASITNDYRCEGNPTQSDPSCEIDSNRQGWTGVGEESYDDIHR